jgi:hypothetical protein
VRLLNAAFQRRGLLPHAAFRLVLAPIEAVERRKIAVELIARHQDGIFQSRSNPTPPRCKRFGPQLPAYRD